MTRTLIRGVRAAVAVVLVLACRPAARADKLPEPPAASPQPLGGELSALVEADWLAEDAAAGGGCAPARTREVVERAEALRERLARPGDAARFARFTPRLDELRGRLAELDARGDIPETERRQLYLDARRLLREIAFSNPLLRDIDAMLFIKRHHSVGVFHMCDQYYGCNARPGGSLYVLRDPLTPKPRLVDLLEGAVVERGRLKGRTLAGGSVLSPELGFDGKTILFAHSEATAYATTGGKETYQWGPEISYHIFRIQADGTGLVQLTDGDDDDFDPCFLPDGRIAFITTRRGGYLRCGRHCPVYTMFTMDADGGDIRRLSYHETHEWHPSVAHDGRIVYTRWDYVDRDTNVAHHIWTCLPDGSDPRTPHGNYPRQRQDRPWMEMSIRAVPGSHRFVAVTGAHHGHALGSLVLIDPWLEDDGAMSQLTRLTPETPFPEAEGRPIEKYMIYATPWPLSEDDYLVAYDREAKNQGIYWLDRFGNRELIYRDPAIPCWDPIPLRPRPRPPVIPGAAAGSVDSSVASVDCEAGKRPTASAPATVALMNVYDSAFDWPEGTEIAALRVIQALPKTTPPPNQPRIGVADQTNARAVLGTAPVERDGSAYFEVPPGRAVYFQALDRRGLAVQSMRSATYVQPGGRLVCQGCHEPKHRAPGSAGPPAALLREPSKLEPGPDGSSPFSYVRLVQPVLDRHCVECHRQRDAIDLSGEPDKQFTRSYNNLAGKYGFYFHVSNGSINAGVHGGSRTTAGAFGAAAAPLLQYLDQRHYDVRLPEDDFRRVALWLDCNSEFYGSYEETEAQRRGEVVPPTLD